MLHMQKLSKVYRTHMIETHALREIDLLVREGEFVAVTGPSGSGKTTFLNIAGLLEEFTGGDYLLDGVSTCAALDDNARSRLRNEKIGFIFQGFNLIPDLNLFDNVDVPLRYRGYPAAERKRASRTPWARSGWLRGRSTTRPNCRAASSSAWRSRARWPAARACCSRMSPPATSTPRWRAA
jgi:ABC-type lipoprotein export system ATPase subunit